MIARQRSITFGLQLKIYIIRSTRHNFLLKKLYSYYSDSYHQFPRQLSTFCLEKKISSKEENSVFRQIDNLPDRELRDTDTFKSRSKNYSSIRWWTKFSPSPLRDSTFCRIQLDVSSSSARGRNMRVGIKFGWKSSNTHPSRVRPPLHPSLANFGGAVCVMSAVTRRNHSCRSTIAKRVNFLD